MRDIRVAFLGFGNVGKALARLFIQKKQELSDRYGISITATGIFTASHGAAVDPAGINLPLALSLQDFTSISKIKSQNPREFIQKCVADVVFENTPVNYATGQPAADHLMWSLENNMHAITANKGPVVHAYLELCTAARKYGKKFLFESTVMDGAPIFSLFREALPGANLLSFRGVLNSTTNMILTLMEQGQSFDQAVARCQEIGIAETDPSGDIDGWDAAVKVAALSTVLMQFPLKPTEIERTGVRDLDSDAVKQAIRKGMRWKLICSARRVADRVIGRVAPELVGPESPMYGASGTTSIIQFETDVLGLLSVVEADPGPSTTAYGLFADFLHAVKDECSD